jgi:cobyrinic acid a,c-diamide synthase
MKSQFLIAAAHSGAGKTTVTLGLLKTLQRRGYVVQPFKCGADYIDPMHHRTASGRDSINLDRYIMSDGHIRSLYTRYTSDADVAITEGVMGLFDGAQKREGSSADIAGQLGLPVILVLNAKAMAYSAAAILFGLKNFDPAIHVAGVLFNFVNSEVHYKLLQEACEDVGVKALGYLPVNEGLRIPSRHLGLDTAEAGAAIEAAADHIEKYVDIAGLLEVTAIAEEHGIAIAGGHAAAIAGGHATAMAGKNGREMRPDGGDGVGGDDGGDGGGSGGGGGSNGRGGGGGGRVILVARDAAFHFIYPENIRQLENWGRVSFFSPLQDQLPVIPDVLYLPGGYPELYAEQLSSNTRLLEQLRSFAAGGGKILAECGGMMYLGKTVTDEAGKTFPMAGILDLSTSMQPKGLSLGYRRLVLNGRTVRGHEFHYSQFVDRTEPVSAGEVFGARDQRLDIPVFYTPGVFASYMHFYWGEQGSLIEDWLG